MPWDDERFERFLEATIRMAKGQLPGYGYPHVVFPYQPTEERTCIERLRGLPPRLAGAGLSATVIPVARQVAHALKRFATRPLERPDEYDRLQSDLSAPTRGIAVKAAEGCVKGIIALPTRPGVIVLGRLGALYPFAHVSTFLEALHQAFQESGTSPTVAVAYPGTAEGTRLRFLGLVDPTGGYRGHVVT